MTMNDALSESIVLGYYTASVDQWAELEEYYLGNQPPTMLTQAQRDSPKFRRFWQVVNVCGVIVDEPVGYLVNAEVKVRVPGDAAKPAFGRPVDQGAVSLVKAPANTAPAPDAATQPAEPLTGQSAPPPAPDATPQPAPDTTPDATGTPDLGKGGGTTSPMAEWAVSFIKSRVKPKAADLLIAMGIFGEGYLYVYVDDEGLNRGLKLRAVAPMESGQERVQVRLTSDEEEVLEGRITWRTTGSLNRQIVTTRATINAARILVEERGARRDGRLTDWTTVSNDENSYGATPLVRFKNSTPSDLQRIIPLQDDLNKSAYDIRVTREYHGFPMLTTPDAKDVTSLEVGPGKVLVGSFSRLDPGDLGSLIVADNETMGRIALLSASLILQEKGGAAPSGLALSYLQQSFQYKVRAKADALEAGYAQLLTLVARMLYTSEALYDAERPTDAAGNLIAREAFADPKFVVEVIPQALQDKAAQMQADLAAVAGGAMSIEEFSRRNGVDPYVATKEIEGNMARRLALEAKYAPQPAEAPAEAAPA